MKGLSKSLACLLVSFILGMGTSSAQNQTEQLSPVLPGSQLPFSVKIEQANFQLPVGIHSGIVGTYNGLWIFIAGRTNGLHGFGPDPFPPSAQNTSIYVVDPATGKTTSRSLKDRSSGLNQQQIDTLSVTSPQGYQEGDTFYMTGGYGVDTATGTFGTKPVLTAINLPGIVKWVTEPNNTNHSVIKNIKQLYNPIFQITGGKMYKLGTTTQLIFGQTFTGVYTDGSNGVYSEQVRRFRIMNGRSLSVAIMYSKPHIPDPNLRRRDLNVVPVLLNSSSRINHAFVAYAGVFTPATGVWTVPVFINRDGVPTMADPNSPTSFKQAMNQYVCAAVGLYSRRNMNMYNIFFGGISFGFFTNGVFQTDSEIPFINNVTTIKMDNNRNFTQYLMANQYPVISSTTVNPGNQLLFGAGASFIVNTNVSQYPYKILALDNIHRPTVIGYIVGGIASTVPNTSVDADSFASPYVFKVTLTPQA